MRFSEREGITPVRTAFQIDSVDEPLRNGLWNVLQSYIITPMLDGLYRDHWIFLNLLWTDHYKLRRDQAPYSDNGYFEYVEERIFEAKWYKIYDFIQFCLDHFPQPQYINDSCDLPKLKYFCGACNRQLQREMSAWRIVGKQLTRLTSPAEIEAVEAAQALGGSYRAVAIHISAAIRLMSDRKSPDYRNSIKETISAVESVCRIIANDPKATLGDALKKVEKMRIDLHPSLKAALGKLYGYTSDHGGIRHSLLDQSNLDFEDAKFMLVVCSAFINLLKARSI
jgi:hypothetical protein